MTTRRLVLKMLAGSGLAALAPSILAKDAHAGDAPAEITAEVMVLHATNEGKGIDPGIGDLPELKKPPFSSYDTYKLLGKTNHKLAKGKEQDKKLPNDSKLLLTYKDLVPAKKNEPEKFAVGMKIKKPDDTEFVSSTFHSPKGQYFFVAGPKYKNGVLVIGIKIV
jgi:hypothetical protein